MQIPTPNAHKEWAKHMRALVGGHCKVTTYHDETESHQAYIFESETPEGIVAATVGLMEFDQRTHQNFSVNTEIIMDKRGFDPRVSSVLSAIAFYVMKNGWKVAPGVVFESIVQMYFPETKLPHILFTSPYQWKGMSKVQLSDITIYPLLAIPVSEAESNLAMLNKGMALENVWAEESVDVLDWNRISSV
ncbi:suppressor of fused protein SUFU [Fluviicoccus keumensis]|uniref:Suppressor of fused protein SUFU n=1 Tax=Fluviicoccus keumensis TaxID=1435465 RepID=A0A4Q7YMD9_9GAMM|nr:suppressor of fused domain protein [Fluviicoccus keumensis]RZU38530.1 suppressor of fused protein SUFU [Fluviicoccus keumensis]